MVHLWPEKLETATYPSEVIEEFKVSLEDSKYDVTVEVVTIGDIALFMAGCYEPTPLFYVRGNIWPVTAMGLDNISRICNSKEDLQREIKNIAYSQGVRNILRCFPIEGHTDSE